MSCQAYRANGLTWNSGDKTHAPCAPQSQIQPERVCARLRDYLTFLVAQHIPAQRLQTFMQPFDSERSALNNIRPYNEMSVGPLR